MWNRLGLIIVWTYLNSCVSTEHSSGLQSSQNIYTDFCKLSGVDTAINQGSLWSAASVQFHISELIAQPTISKTPWLAYPVAYKKMTAARDQARCGGVLQSDDAFLARMNDLLSDIMSRFYMSTVDQCAASGANLGSEHGFCALMARMKKEKFDSLSAAMASTGVYISSHISLALSAILFADDFWAASPYPDTYAREDDWARVLKARTERMRSYKPVYDKFNGFLADNIKIVASALSEAQLLNGDVLYFLSGISRYVPFKALLFGKIRDDAFAVALELAKEMNPADHPMMVVRGGIARIHYGNYNFSFSYPERLARLEQEGIEFAANPANMFIYRNVLGGKTWEEVASSSEP